MNHSNLWISLDINKISSQLTLTLKQGETGRAVHISLTEDGRPYHISERCYAYLQALKTDSINPLSHPCTIENNTITYYVDKNMTSTVGRVECEVVLRSEDGQIIVTSSFAIVVYKTVYGELEEEYEPEKNTLTQIISEANTTVASIKDKLVKGEFNAGFASEMNVTTTTGEAGSKASVEVTPDDSTPNGAKKFNFDFTIPRGDKGKQGEKGDKGEKGEQGVKGEKGETGEKGESSTVKIGTVTTGKPNTEAKVTNSGTETNAVLNFTLPIGEQAVRILTKAEYDRLEAKENGIIYVFSDDDTLDHLYKYEKNNADFSDLDSLYTAPSGCYNARYVYDLPENEYYTVFISEQHILVLAKSGEAYTSLKGALHWKPIHRTRPQFTAYSDIDGYYKSYIKFYSGEVEYFSPNTFYDIFVETVSYDQSQGTYYNAVGLPIMRIMTDNDRIPTFSPIHISQTTTGKNSVNADALIIEEYRLEKKGTSRYYALNKYTYKISKASMTTNSIEYSVEQIPYFRITLNRD